jgi:hypothetical protein
LPDNPHVERTSRTKIALIALAALGALALFVGGLIGVARATDSSSFCANACHEMKPYAAAWHQGPHAEVGCIQCHVQPGFVARLKHKLVALDEVKMHLTGTPTFPLPDSRIEPVPNSRCQQCHKNPTVNKPGFSHAQHAARRDCVACHFNAGHAVTPAALAAAGILNPATSRGQQIKLAGFGIGAADLPDHISVVCSDCHRMSSTSCQTCHAQPSNHVKTNTTVCATCHAPGEKFVFTHPAGQTDCASCHPTRPDHFETAAECTVCHTKPGVTWAFAHATKNVPACDTCHAAPAKHRPGACASCHTKPGVTWAFAHTPSVSCTACHKPPAGHRSGACSSCHRRAGVSWAFTHPGTTACATCHSRPARHRSGNCLTCHRNVGVSWRFTHPASTRCTTCHTRPSGHRSGSCLSCHRAGASWRFYHPSSSRCASCHRAPANHYGTTCASCHSPSRAWSSAVFRHPSTGGEHSYRSFACTKCHPSGPPRVYCTCHNGRPPTGD